MERARLRALLRATGCVEEHGGLAFLCDPHWTAAERTQAAARQAAVGGSPGGDEPGWVCIPTGGTSGGVRFARHDEHTLGAAARGFRAHFGLERVNAVDVLPPFHVSGLMARIRCAATGGTHVACEWRRLVAGERPELPTGDSVISLVPTQLQRLLRSPEAVAWLRRFRVVLLGGGPMWAGLADEAAAAELPVSLSYGMTETAAMVAALSPAEFLAGARDCGPALPHAKLGVDADGAIVVEGDSVFHGYVPEWRASRRFVTDDAGEIDARGHLRVFGRRDAVIITGGRKVQPAEVESVLRGTGQFADVAVLGMKDPEWGEAVVACYPAGEAGPDLALVRAAVERDLAPFKRPKRFVPVTDWPRTTHGKLNRAQLGAALARG